MPRREWCCMSTQSRESAFYIGICYFIATMLTRIMVFGILFFSNPLGFGKEGSRSVECWKGGFGTHHLADIWGGHSILCYITYMLTYGGPFHTVLYGPFGVPKKIEKPFIHFPFPLLSQDCLLHCHLYSILGMVDMEDIGKSRFDFCARLDCTVCLQGIEILWHDL